MMRTFRSLVAARLVRARADIAGFKLLRPTPPPEVTFAHAQNPERGSIFKEVVSSLEVFNISWTVRQTELGALSEAIKLHTWIRWNRAARETGGK